MNYQLLKDLIDLAADFEKVSQNQHAYTSDIQSFKQWVAANASPIQQPADPDWEGKSNGRSAESAIATLLVHLNRYAKTYSKSAIAGSEFSTQDDFIYLINLNVFGEMTKMELIKKNIHEKPAGMQIINRLIAQGWVEQQDSVTDKRSKLIRISSNGKTALENQMQQIRQATTVVAADLTQTEKMELVRLLSKLNDFHQPIYQQNLKPNQLLDVALHAKANPEPKP